jgi:FemAB-related protein (PEP-CTERM system-associated)
VSTVETRATTTVSTHWGAPNADLQARWERLCRDRGENSPSRRLEWLTILHGGLDHRPLLIEARSGDETLGMLPLEFLEGRLFGKFLVGLPYLNVGGVLATDLETAGRLIDTAVRLSDELDVKYLELRHEVRHSHPQFNHEMTEKVHMRLPLTGSHDELWQTIGPKVRNQVRKAEKEGLTICWGRNELLGEFYDVYSRNMRDLGTPVFSSRLFAAILHQLGDSAEFCVARHGRITVAAALLVHGRGMTEVPSASSLRRWNHLNGNMLVYWNLLKRAIDRGQQVFDFGRSSAGSNTYRFKAQWGAAPHPAVWQYYVRQGSVSEMRPNHPKNQRRIAVWKRLPVWLTRLAGPPIVRGIP